jgi:AP-3 complex subunit beta
MSPLVRKAAALAIPKCWRLDPNTAPQLTDYLSQLLGDKQYFVAGAAVITFMEVCPDRIDLIHKHYRGLCRKLVDMDEWGQLATLRLMLSYGRRCFPRRTHRVHVRNGSKSSKGFYSDEESDAEDEAIVGPVAQVALLDPDLELLLKNALPLLQSRNSNVIVAVTRLYLCLSPPTSPYLPSTVGPLISLFRSANDIQQIALHNVVQVALLYPQHFVRYTTHFLVRSTDPPQISRLKLELLTLIFPHAPPHAQSLVLSELTHFSRSSTTSIIREAVRAIGRCAQSTPPGSITSTRCLRLLLAQLNSANGSLVAESLTVIRHLIQANPDAHVNTVTRLAKNLDTMTNAQARASVIWLVGEFAGTNGGDNVAADVLRILCRGFANEEEEVRGQVMLLGAKVYLLYLNRTQPQSQEEASADQPSTSNGTNEWSHHSAQPANEEPKQQERHAIPLLYTYLLQLVRYDTSYTLRDRARTYRALLSDPTSTQLASLLLLAPKPVPSAPSPSESRKGFMLGSASLVIGPGGDANGAGNMGEEEAGVGIDGFEGYQSVPEWVEDGKEPNPRLREEDAGVGTYISQAQQALNMSASDRLEKGVDIMGGMQDSGMGVAGGRRTQPVKAKTLDDWLAEDEKAGKVEEDEEEDEDEDEEETGSEEDGEESEEEETDSEEDSGSEEDESDEEEDRAESSKLMK